MASVGSEPEALNLNEFRCARWLTRASRAVTAWWRTLCLRQSCTRQGSTELKWNEVKRNAVGSKLNWIEVIVVSLILWMPCFNFFRFVSFFSFLSFLFVSYRAARREGVGISQTNRQTERWRKCELVNLNACMHESRKLRRCRIGGCAQFSSSTQMGIVNQDMDRSLIAKITSPTTTTIQ